MSENIGEIETSYCGETVTAYIRKKNKGGKNYPLYICVEGTTIFFNTKKGQNWILENGSFYDSAGDLPLPTVEAVMLTQDDAPGDDTGIDDAPGDDTGIDDAPGDDDDEEGWL